MSIYAFQIILICLFGLLFRKDKKKFLIFAFLILFVVMAFRHARMVGYDSTSSYYSMFLGIEKYTLSWPNPGLPLVMKVIHAFSGDYQWVIIITAIWVCFAYYKLLIKYSEGAFISVMWFMGLLFYTVMLSAIKQAWAMAFLCFAFDAIFEKRPIRFLLFVGLASIFHFPALVFLPAYWIGKLRINKAFPLLMFSAFVIVFIFRQQILNLMTSTYSNGEGTDYSATQFLGTKVLFMILLLSYGVYRYYLVGSENRVFCSLLYYMGIAAVIQTFCFYNNIFERLADYYYQFSILFLPLILKRSDLESNHIDNATQDSVTNERSYLTKVGKKSISIGDIDTSSILAVVIVAFCVWRYISYMVNDAFFSPFYFFWQDVNIALRFS